MDCHYFQDAAVNFSIFIADTSPADISDSTKIHKHNIKVVILTAQNHLMPVLEVTKLSYFIFLFSSFFPTNAAFTIAGPALPQKLLNKCRGIKNQKKCCDSCV